MTVAASLRARRSRSFAGMFFPATTLNSLGLRGPSPVRSNLRFWHRATLALMNGRARLGLPSVQPHLSVDIAGRIDLGCITDTNGLCIIDTKMTLPPPELNEREMEAIRFIANYTDEFHQAPTVRDLGRAVYRNSGTNPVYLVNSLRRKRLVSRLSRRHRILTLTPTGQRWFEQDSRGRAVTQPLPLALA